MAGNSIHDIKDFHDIIRLLEEHPEWRAELRRVVLTDELLALPAQVLRLTEQVTALSDAQRRTDAQLATLTEQVTALTRAVQVLTEDVGTLKGDVHTLKEDTGTLKGDVHILKEDTGTLKADVHILKEDTGTLKADVHILKEDTATLKADVRILKDDVHTLKGDVHTLKTEVGTLKTDTDAIRVDVGTLKDGVGELRGKSLENHYRAAGSPFFGALLRHPSVLSRGEVTDLLDEAVDRGVLSPDDAVEVQRADLIVRGTRRMDGVPVYLVVEVSWTVDTNDVERAARRAALLAKAGTVVMSVVAGEKIGEPARLLAPTRHVWQMTDDEIVPPTS